MNESLLGRRIQVPHANGQVAAARRNQLAVTAPEGQELNAADVSLKCATLFEPATLQIPDRTLPSRPAVAIALPSGEKAMLVKLNSGPVLIAVKVGSPLRSSNRHSCDPSEIYESARILLAGETCTTLPRAPVKHFISLVPLAVRFHQQTLCPRSGKKRGETRRADACER